MSPLHVNMTNVFHTGRPKGSITTPTSVANNARPLPTSKSLCDYFTRLKRILAKYAGFVGPGILISIAYMDPGNYSTDISAGAQFQYKLLSIILISNILACFLQALACKLGSVTGKDFAQVCAENFPNWLRWILYLFSEAAIIATDLAEIIGGAIALNLLFGLNIIAGVVITAFDVFLILLLYKPNGTMTGVRWFEGGVSLLVLGVIVCFAIELAKTPNIDGKEVMAGFVPSKVIFTSSGIFASLGILGATIMPHAIFLGSHLALPRVREFDRIHHPERIERINPEAAEARLDGGYKWQPSISAIRSTLTYSITEIVVSLSSFAMFVNCAILIVAGAALNGNQTAQNGDLFAIHDVLSQTLAPAAGTLFALALLFSGQSSSIIATIVGQIVCEGFINWRVRAWVRRGITRLIALIPCVIVASAIGKPGLSNALNISQVMLSILLPFIAAPLIYLTSSKKVMRVAVYSNNTTTTTPPSMAKLSGTAPTLSESSKPTNLTTVGINANDLSPSTSATNLPLALDAVEGERRDEEIQNVEWVDMSTGIVVTVIGWAIWLFITAMNVYLIVQLGLGNG